MWPFAKKKDTGVKSFVLKLLNNNCPRMAIRPDDLRVDSRVNLVLPITIIPVANNTPQLDRAFGATTKDFCMSGVSVVLDRPARLDEVIVGLPLMGKMAFLRGKLTHTDPMGGGFSQLGFQLTETVSLSDFPQLASVA